MFVLTPFLIAAFTLQPPAQAVGQSRMTETAAAVEAIERAYYRRDVDSAGKVLTDIGDEDACVRAWAMWRLANLHPIHGVSRAVKRTNEARRKALLEDAERLLSSHLDRSTGDPVATLVLSQVYQSRITSMMSGMRFGRRAGETLERALALDPENPHILYHKGINQLMAPGPFGDKEEALRNLRHAVAMFEAERVDGAFVWGHAEALAFLGLSLAREGETAAALEHYERALALEPGYVWVREELILELP